jgi:prenylcysteine alpha-carboxyl methylesterase
MGSEAEYNTIDVYLEGAYLHRSPSGSRRRKASGDVAESDGGGGGGVDGKAPSFRQDMEHAAAETYLITRLTFTLLQYLG